MPARHEHDRPVTDPDVDYIEQWKAELIRQMRELAARAEAQDVDGYQPDDPKSEGFHDRYADA